METPLTVERSRVSAWTSAVVGGVAALASCVVGLAVAPPAGAAGGPDETLAARYAPVVRLVKPSDDCAEGGEPYEPIDVDALFGQETVALRGPWSPPDLVKIGPTAADLVGRFEYHLDFPGDTLDPGCDYRQWQRLIIEGKQPTTYAHVVRDASFPGKLALQYWFFYVFNNFNNLHEGDWEMIQLVFDARDAQEALSRTPVEVGYSSHEGAEGAGWGDDKLELVDGTHPIVYPSAGSHANKFTEALYLGSSAEAGVGCDDTRGPHLELHPAVRTIPSDRSAAERVFPWIAFQGRWGERQKAFFNGPTGPNLKTQWTEPIAWSEGWRDRSYAVPTGGALGTGATDFFCAAVAAGSRALIGLLRDPGLTLLVLAALLALIVLLATRTAWRPSTPLSVARRRRWGQVVSAAGRMYFSRPATFVGIGAVFLPIGVAISIVQGIILGGFGLTGIDVTGEAAGGLVVLLLAVGTTLALLGFALVQAATACAVVEIEAGRSAGAFRAYAAALRRIRPLLGATAVAATVWLVLNLTTILIPIAIWLAVRWILLAQVVELENRSAVAALRRSAALVRGRWLRVGSLVGFGAVLALAAGPLLGALLIVLTDAPLAMLNVVAGFVYAFAIPFVALTATYVYFDARVSEALSPERAPTRLPPEADVARLTP